MTTQRLYLEDSLVAPELRSRLVRVDPRLLTSKLPAPKKCNQKHVARLFNGLIAIGVFTPILLDDDGDFVAGHGLVAAAIELGLEDIPAIAGIGQTLSELEAYVGSMARFLHLAGLDPRVFKTEARHALLLIALLETAAEQADCVA